MASAAPPSRRWIFGPAPDLVLGCGVGYVLLAAAAAVAPFEPLALLTFGVLATYVVGMPHYGATLLRVYERSEDRRRYVIFAGWATLAVWLAFAAGIYSAFIGSVLLTVYLTWSPWHYTGQNYGIAVMFLRRRGVDLEARTKRLLYASFLLSYGLALLALHSTSSAGNTGPEIVGQAYRFMSLGIPAAAFGLLFPAVLAAYAGTLAASAWLLLRRASASSLGPAAALVALQALWFVVPSVALWGTGHSPATTVIFFFFIWVAIGHSVQYLWITTYYAAASEPASGRLRYLVKALAAGAAIWTVPALIFAPALLGDVPYRIGLYMLVASAVNIHHFILDGAIWKLRGRVAKVLLGAAPADAAEGPPSGRPWLRRAVWAVCTASVAIALLGESLYHLAWLPAVKAADGPRAAAIERAMRWLGRDDPAFYDRRGAEAVGRDDLAGAARHYEESLALYPTPEAWLGLADVRARQGDSYAAIRSVEESLAIEESADAWAALGQLRRRDGDQEGALAAWEAALRLDPDQVVALHGAGRHWLEQGRARRARRLLQRAAQIAPHDEVIRSDLIRARDA